MPRSASLSDQLVVRADVEAELLVGIIRMIVASILMIAIFMAISFDHEPVAPWVERDVTFSIIIVASYFTLGVASVLVVWSNLYRSWMAWCFAIVEIILVLLNILISIANTNTSSQFALVGTSIGLLAIVLVLGTLRLRPKLQLAVSLVLLIAITLIVFWGPRNDEPGYGLTAQIIEEAFSPISNGFRIVMLTMVACIVYVAVWHGRRLLEQVAQESEKLQNQNRFLPSKIASHMTDENLADLRTGREVELAIMFVDIRGFTAMSETMTTKETSSFLSEFRSKIIDLVTLYNGIVDKFIGDGALIVFGLDSSKEATAKAALATALDRIRDIKDWNNDRIKHELVEIRLVIGLHIGTVIVGAIGDMRRLEFTVIGRTVNEASRMEGIGKQLNLALVTSSRLVELAEGRIKETKWQNLGKKHLRGCREPFDLFGLDW